MDESTRKEPKVQKSTSEGYTPAPGTISNPTSPTSSEYPLILPEKAVIIQNIIHKDEAKPSGWLQILQWLVQVAKITGIDLIVFLLAGLIIYAMKDRLSVWAALLILLCVPVFHFILKPLLELLHTVIFSPSEKK